VSSVLTATGIFAEITRQFPCLFLPDSSVTQIYPHFVLHPDLVIILLNMSHMKITQLNYLVGQSLQAGIF
jgi:hypothetical protein